MKRLLLFSLLLALGLTACSRTTIPTQTISELVASDERLVALEDALADTELVATLSSPGPFTVFTPSDDAFKNWENPPATLDDLKQVLLYHVIAERLEAATLTSRGSGTLTTVQGASLAFVLEDGKVFLTDAQNRKATITTTDLQATNGVVHIIDTVLLPQ